MTADKDMIQEIVEKVLKELAKKDEGFEKDKDPSGILRVRTETVKCEPFAGAPGVGL